jgi:outer membrane receptor protein involved in Fe transport
MRCKIINWNNQALFVVDGVPVDNSIRIQAHNKQEADDYGNAAADINPNDIESINVLKAASLYMGQELQMELLWKQKD